ncbi:hypothetical protein Bca4012_067100 [Brassica carinata]
MRISEFEMEKLKAELNHLQEMYAMTQTKTVHASKKQEEEKQEELSRIKDVGGGEENMVLRG